MTPMVELASMKLNLVEAGLKTPLAYIGTAATATPIAIEYDEFARRALGERSIAAAETAVEDLARPPHGPVGVLSVWRRPVTLHHQSASRSIRA